MLSTYFDEARKILLGLLSWENRTMSESFESRFVLHEGTLSERTKNMDELLETLLAVIKTYLHSLTKNEYPSGWNLESTQKIAELEVLRRYGNEAAKNLASFILSDE
ncbi:Oidioi.mRNA.OKI2018_I69.PAR.g11813.t1.cds [Oikopleura dioica]|uniref:Oidioi.mRNA.OKI2018_I69.PAR.g11813.t1.cds n=1 Tax=Oikopleura dioica TaxID=34765 RepID=A0ABN7S479_OIKDI|nr:Oidioi.mRNA.OKI2018_I69.PAR.g11813.t1.cds [Oikopleura dioica]